MKEDFVEEEKIREPKINIYHANKGVNQEDSVPSSQTRLREENNASIQAEEIEGNKEKIIEHSKLVLAEKAAVI